MISVSGVLTLNQMDEGAYIFTNNKNSGSWSTGPSRINGGCTIDVFLNILECHEAYNQIM